MSRLASTLALVGILLGLAGPADAQSSRWRILLLQDGGIAEATDGPDLLTKVAAKYSGTNFKFSLVPGMPSGMPNQFQYPIYGTMYTSDGSPEIPVSFGGVSVQVRQYKPNGTGNVEAIAVLDQNAEWVVWVALGRKAVQAAGIEGNALDLGKALGARLATSDQENETKSAALTAFAQGLRPEFDEDSEVSEALIQRFTSDVARMDDGTGLLTFRNASEGAEIGRRALELLRQAKANAGSDESTGILGGS